MPTPARLATASRLASGPPPPKTAAAASSRSSRLRIESERGRRTVFAEEFFISVDQPSVRITKRRGPPLILAKRRKPPYSYHSRYRGGTVFSAGQPALRRSVPARSSDSQHIGALHELLH